MKLPLVFLLVSSFFAATQAKAPNYTAEAKLVVSNLAAGHYDAVESTFTPQMAQALSAKKLEAFWAGLNTKFGAFGGIGGSSVTEHAGYHTVVLDCKFKKQELGLALVFNDNQKLAGIQIRPAPAKTKRSASDYVAAAKEVVSNLAAGHYDAVEKAFTPQMAQAAPAGKLKELWATLTTKFGAFGGIGGSRVTEQGGYHTVVVDCKFKKQELGLALAFDDNLKLAGLHIVPAVAKTSWLVPNYAKPSKFHERAVTVVYQRWQLPGTLTLPDGKGPFAGVVLVPGSGPNDEDETFGPNKPFKDLAWGLATRGIAVLRYPKRTKQYGPASAPRDGEFTVNDTTVNDGRAAAALLAKQPEIDPHEVYVLGHSLGGMMAPRIATNNPNVSGMIIMAGPTQPFGKIVVRQTKYLVSIEGPGTAQGEREIRLAEAFERAIDSPSLKPNQIVVEPPGVRIPGSYFLDLRGYHPAQVAAKLKIPILVLQGGKDFNVTRVDFEGWKRALAGDRKATFKFYPDLTHLFMPSASKGSALGTPADDFRPGHVSATVVNDIADWVLTQARGRA